MDDTAKAYIESISKHCYQDMTFYQFNKNTLKVSDKYREGRLTALKYVSELTWYYLQQEKHIKEEFRQQLIKQMKLHSCLENNEFKQGLFDALNDVLNLNPEYSNYSRNNS